ncbi:MAG TPA: energy transducer TonB [Gammaproteobacteria bacterium]
MIPRYAIAAVLGAAVTLCLLFAMQLLIQSGRGSLNQGYEVGIVDFVRVEREPSAEADQWTPERPPEPQPQPVLPQSNQTDFGRTALAVSISTPTLSEDIEIGSVGFGGPDGEYLPVEKIAPIYPAAAVANGLEGYVVVEYTVSRTGATKNVQVVESSSSVFDSACVEAAARFKYKPRVLDGEPVEVRGVRNKCTFQFED